MANLNSRPRKIGRLRSPLENFLGKVDSITRGINNITRTAANLNSAIRNIQRTRDNIRRKKSGVRTKQQKNPLGLSSIAPTPIGSGRNENTRPVRPAKI